ncbi:MAG: GTPase Era [Rhodospirillales bacterium]|nr:GTPase Era [Rhodospirillales bacterium]
MSPDPGSEGGDAETRGPQGDGEAGRRCGFVAIIGAPNAGKSTLVNRLVGSKVSIVSPKVQTTRTRVVGIAIAGATQVLLVDTPGIFAPRRALDRAMVDAAWDAAAGADVIALLVDASRTTAATAALPVVVGLKKRRRQAILVLNKVDAVDKPTLLSLVAALNGDGVFAPVFMISALTGDGVGELASHLAATLPPGPWLYPEDQLSDMPARLLAAEITREQLFWQLQQELPYSIAVETEQWSDRSDDSIRLDQVIWVEREGQRPIVLGRGGQRIRQIGESARKELERLFGHRVHLFLHVKVRERWREDPAFWRLQGLEPRR